MSKESKKLFGYLLTLVMVISMVCTGSMTAQAAVLTNNGTTITGTAGNITVSTNEDGQTVYKLTGDVTDGLSLTLENNETAVLNGQNYKISGKAAVSEDPNYEAGTPALSVPGTPALSVSGTGTLIIENAKFSGGNGGNSGNGSGAGISVSSGVNVVLKGSVTIEAGSASSESSANYDGSTGMEFSGNSLVFKEESQVTIKGSDGANRYSNTGGSGLLFNGKIFTLGEGAYVGLTGGAGSTAGKKFDYKGGLVPESFLSEITGVTTRKVTLQYYADNSKTYIVKDGSTIDSAVLPYPERDGYSFAGWCTDDLHSTAYDFSQAITSDITLYANWTANSYTVTFDTNGGSTVDPKNVAHGQKATAPTTNPTKAGYTFGGWYTDNTCNTPYDFNTPVITNITLYAKWTAEKRTVTFDTKDGSNVDSQRVDYNTTATKPTLDPKKEGYTFGGWYEDENCTQEYDFSKAVTSDITLYAKWMSNDAGVTEVSVDGTVGTIVGTTITVVLPYGSTIPTDVGEISVTLPSGATKTTPVSGDNGKTWTFTVTAQDGSTVNYTVNVSVSACGHASKKTVKENEVAATCTKGGSYDEVVYCSTCGEQISSTHKTVKATGHKWDAGKVTKEPTTTETGVKTYTCSVCKATKTEVIPVKAAEAPKQQGITPEQKKKNELELNKKSRSKVSEDGLKITWGKVEGADGYDIYASICGPEYKGIEKSVKGNKTSIVLQKIAGKKIDPQKQYRVRVVAYQMIDGEKVEIAEGLPLHAVSKDNAKYTNTKKLKVKKSSYTLAPGESVKLKVKNVKQSRSKQLLPKSHGAALRYVSSDENVASITSKGTIKAKGEGTCYIYIFALNGVNKKVEVTVK